MHRYRKWVLYVRGVQMHSSFVFPRSFFRDRLFLLKIELRFPAVDSVRFMPFRVSQRVARKKKYYYGNA